MSKFRFIDKNFCICGEYLVFKNTIIINHSWGKIKYIKCNSCLTWNQSPEISIDSILSWYNSDDYQKSGKEGGYLNYESEEIHRNTESLLRYNRLIKYNKIKMGSALEVGCASGSFLKILRENGWSVVGIDISERFCELAKKNDINVICDDFNALKFNERFDLIIILGSISNLQSVKKSIRKAYKLLNKGGCIYINYPDCSSITSKLYGNKHWMFTPSVNTFFSSSGIKILLEKEGFINVKIQRDWQKPPFSKLITHAKLPNIFKLKELSFSLPISLPIPGLRTLIAYK